MCTKLKKSEALTYRGVYALTSPHCFQTQSVDTFVNELAKAQVRWLQFRDKSQDKTSRMTTALQLRELTREHDITLIINDDVELAQAVEADGVHLGQKDTDLQTARDKLGQQAIIGATCHNSLILAQKAIEHSADYIAFGSLFPSNSKPEATPAKIDTLLEASHNFGVPIVGIGGIDATNIQLVAQSGAQMAAVVAALYTEENVELAARKLQAGFWSNEQQV
ncbi:MAG: thiamine phosphate synthase [Pseudomonadota bacterium]